PAALDPDSLRRALGTLPAQHDALRLRFRHTPSGWLAEFTTKAVEIPLHVEAVTEEATLAARAAELETALDLGAGPGMRAALFVDPAGGPGKLFLTIHHLAVDGVSWRPLLEDLETAYEQLHQGQPLNLPAKSSSFKAWAEGLLTLARTDAIQQEWPFWQAQLAGPRLTAMSGHGTIGETKHQHRALDAERTSAFLHEIGSRYNSNANDALLAALSLAFAHELDWPGFTGMVEGHGREEQLHDEADLSRTVGWFTTHYPVHLQLPPRDGYGEALKAVKEQLRRIPNSGIGYGLNRYLGDKQAESEPDILFNYLGQFERTLPQSNLFQLDRPLQAG
ncbi:MAG: hypothetical protein KDE34_28180, partial [Anaerolineales bacterium]|nr:hypothetical protein [Anaerolineales bacterium]